MRIEMLDIQQNIVKANSTDRKVQNLAAKINVDTLRVIHEKMDGSKATGIDDITKEEYGRNLETNLERLVKRMKNGSYMPNPPRRVYIPKATKGKFRPLGISCYEDKLVETAIANILTQIYEPKFYDFSYGFRPDRSCHMAIRDIIDKVQWHKTNFVVDADIHSFFDTVDHEWLLRMLEHDIADRRFIDLIRKFLKAGIMEDGKFLDSEVGTPQGNGASPVLANVYLHYILDNWFDVIVKRQCKGEAFLVRYADDWVCTFQHETEAQIFLSRVKDRLGKYGLALADEKTRILKFGSRSQDSDTFDFLGFTFYDSTDRNKAFYRCKVRTSKKKFRLKLKEMSLWLKENRCLPLNILFDKVGRKLRGHYQYYGVTDNIYEIKNYRYRTVKLIFYWLNRRSSRKSYSWDGFINGLLRTFPLPKPRISVNLLSVL